ncbi:AmmeMemoRadiSam system radical SAM enzyme, partial [Candidatus Gottesmanbacteria bacterium]|nr:AmmeMemoRadiSam system radical SAM enzyme [Candidatus Gottesmanbacteria bacterium]
MLKEAILYRKLKDNSVRCHLCSHRCLIPDGKRGLCSVRENHKGRLYSLVYGLAIAANVDPIEKKPLFHFQPGSLSFSIATAGCNFRCQFCQNWDISQISKGLQGQIIGKKLPPEEIVKKALETDCRSIAYTYTEPTIFFEYAYDTAKLAKKKGLANVFVTNGYQTPETIKEMAKFVDAANIDLKSFSDEFYQKICGARLAPVLEAIKLMYKAGIWLEITTLVVPGQNDSEKELNQIAKFIAKVDKNIPWHISRFHPEYKMLDAEPTPIETLEKAYQIGKKAGLNYVYLGNVITETRENTYCPKCENLAIKRVGY